MIDLNSTPDTCTNLKGRVSAILDRPFEAVMSPEGYGKQGRAFVNLKVLLFKYLICMFLKDFSVRNPVLALVCREFLQKVFSTFHNLQGTSIMHMPCKLINPLREMNVQNVLKL